MCFFNTSSICLKNPRIICFVSHSTDRALINTEPLYCGGARNKKVELGRKKPRYSSRAAARIITMSTDIVSTLGTLIKLGLEIKTRLDSLNQAAEDLQLLTANLMLLLEIFEDPVNEALIKTRVSEFVHILDVLQSIANSCIKYAEALDVDLAGETTATKKAERRGAKFIKRLRAFAKIPELLAEIQRKADQLQQICNVVSTLIVHDFRVQQGRTSGKETVESTAVVKETTTHENFLDLDLSTNFASIDQIVGNLIKECNHLRQQIQEATLIPDTSAVQAFQAQNPEAASFWKDRFQNGELNASTLRYEVMRPSPPCFWDFQYRRIILTYFFLTDDIRFLGTLRTYCRNVSCSQENTDWDS